MALPPIHPEIVRIARSWRMIYYLIDQDLRTAHRDKVFGNIWMLMDPLLMMVVLFIVFRRLRDQPIVFILYLFAGLLAWDIFRKSITGSTNCIAGRKSIIMKFPVPLGIFPAAIVVHKVHDLFWGLLAYTAIFLAILLGSDAELPIPWTIVLLPIWTFFFLLLTLGLCYIVAAIGVFFRDMADVVAILLRVGFFINPVFIDVTRHLPESLHTYYFLFNPVAGYLIYLRLLLPGGRVLLDGYHIPVSHYPVYLGLWSILSFMIGLKIFLVGQGQYSKYL